MKLVSIQNILSNNNEKYDNSKIDELFKYARGLKLKGNSEIIDIYLISSFKQLEILICVNANGLSEGYAYMLRFMKILKEYLTSKK